MKAALRKSFERSALHYEQSRRFLPGGVSSNFRLAMEPFPLCFERAEGPWLFDADGNRYVDYTLGMGPVILGHAAPIVNEAVRKSLERGQLYAGSHEMELALAREICRVVPCAEMVRFSLSGSEAVQAALRAARAYTGRPGILKFEGHYHGWFDNIFVSVQPDENLTGPASAPVTVPMTPGQDPGAYGQVRVLPWNDPEVFARVIQEQGNRIAAVIMEPILCNTSVILPKPGYLKRVRELCSAQGIVLIFDEVITGFRVALGGAQQLLGITPDLAVFAKAMANGYPISCLAGRREIMELFDSKHVMHGGTYNSNVLSCAAALATVQELQSSNGEAYSRLELSGTALIGGLSDLARETCPMLHVQGLPAVFHTTFTDQNGITDYRRYRRCRLDLQSRFVRLLIEHGVRITNRGTWFVSAAHSGQDIAFTLEAAKAALRTLDYR